MLPIQPSKGDRGSPGGLLDRDVVRFYDVIDHDQHAEAVGALITSIGLIRHVGVLIMLYDSHLTVFGQFGQVHRPTEHHVVEFHYQPLAAPTAIVAHGDAADSWRATRNRPPTILSGARL